MAKSKTIMHKREVGDLNASPNPYNRRSKAALSTANSQVYQPELIPLPQTPQKEEDIEYLEKTEVLKNYLRKKSIHA